MTKRRCHGSLGVYSDNTGVDCTNGNNGRPALARYGLVWITIEKRPILKTSGVHHCAVCAVGIKSSGKLNGCIGWLDQLDLDEYEYAATKCKNSTEFISEGLTKVSMDLKLRGFIHMYTANHLCNHNPTSDRLAHDTSGSYEREIVGSGRQNNGRRWCQLYPRDKHTMSISSSDKKCILKPLANLVNELVVRRVLRDTRYAQIAYQRMIKEMEPPIRDINCSRNTVELTEPLLELINMNLLWRGDHDGMTGKKGRQSIHRDGAGYRFVAIVPLQCHTRGYEIFSIPKSHRINDWNVKSKKVVDVIPHELAKAVLANIDQIIVFSERLMHAGGTCSMTKDSEVSTPTFTNGVLKKGGKLFDGWFGQGKNGVARTQPTDVSVQFNFKFKLLEDCTAISGNGGDNIWTSNECWEEGDSSRVSELQKRLDSLPDDVDKSNDGFVGAMKEAEANWLKCLSTNEPYKAGRKRSRGESNQSKDR